ncbi:MAG: hypothetical protein AAF927_31885 [Bacteroidota bacterium]
MFRFFQRFTPAFLKKIDHQLLVSRPGLWATRIHYLLFYWLMGAGLASIFLSLIPIRFSNVSNGENSTIMLMIVSGLALVAWAVQLAHYQPWKQGESNWRLHALRDQAVYLFGLALLICLPLGYFWLHQAKVAHSISDRDFRADVRALNQAQVLLENHKDDIANSSQIWSFSPRYIESKFSIKEAQEIAQSSYLQKREILQRFQELGAKYGSRDMAYALDLDDLIKRFGKGVKVEREVSTVRWLTVQIESNLRALSRAKYNMKSEPSRRVIDGRLILLGVWASFGLVLLLFVRSSWKTFLLSLVSGLGLFLVQSLVFGIGMATDILPQEEEFVVLILILNWLILGGVAFLGEVKSSRQQQIRMIALSLFTVLTTIIPAISKEMIAGGSDRETTVLYLVSCGITFILWNLLLQGRMLQLVVSPKQK